VRAFVVQSPGAAADYRGVIRLHRLALEPQPFHLNPDLVLTIEAHPDTVVTLTTGSRLLVKETPEQVADAVRAWRASVLDAMTRVPRRTSSTALSVVRGTAGDGGAAAVIAENARLEAEVPNRRDRS
jgi:flagellar protein FlbD